MTYTAELYSLLKNKTESQPCFFACVCFNLQRQEQPSGTQKGTSFGRLSHADILPINLSARANYLNYPQLPTTTTQADLPLSPPRSFSLLQRPALALATLYSPWFFSCLSCCLFYSTYSLKVVTSGSTHELSFLSIFSFKVINPFQ